MSHTTSHCVYVVFSLAIYLLTGIALCCRQGYWAAFWGVTASILFGLGTLFLLMKVVQ